MGFDVGYNQDTKAVTIDNKISQLLIDAGGLNVNVKAVNIDRYNYVNLREIAKVLGREIEVSNGKIIIK